MIIGVPRETKRDEYRVALTPDAAQLLIKAGHSVWLEHGAGDFCGFEDSEYDLVGVELFDKKRIFGEAELIVKVREPSEDELEMLMPGQSVFSFLHLAANEKLLKSLLDNKVTAFAYETLEKDGSLPILRPMSEIAGKMSPLIGAFYLQKHFAGTGVLPTGVAGARPAKLLILGAGTVGLNAAVTGNSLGMETVVMNHSVESLVEIDKMFGGRVRTIVLSDRDLYNEIRSADIIVGAASSTGKRTEQLVKRLMLRTLKHGAVIVDVSADQGGCFETTIPTTHSNPVYEVEGITHYAVTNMPSAYPVTSTVTLTNATLPFIKEIADNGIDAAIKTSSELRSSLNTYAGKIIHKGLLESVGAVADQFDPGKMRTKD
ncbi:MAG: alanine dehydrogenase [Dissulfurispiraceae bacterium]|jgi:alanine dehydrogenase|nr:alanine dehydrogenase [Dissulfurispiraceae bacterium]